MKLIVTIGPDQKNRGHFYWDVKDAAMNPIAFQTGFKSLDDAQKGFEEFKKNLIKTDITLVNG